MKIRKLTILVIVIFAGGSVFSATVSADRGMIPSWIKSVSGWWSEGKISDDEYLNATQFLIQNGMIKIPKMIDLQNQIALLKSQLNNANLEIASLKQQLTQQSAIQINQNPLLPPQASNLDYQKGIAKSWSQGQISDAQFMQEIQALIDNGVIQPFNGTSIGDGTAIIPQWIKNNAGWWADGQVDDSTYRAGLTYLFNQGYLHNPTANSQITPSAQNTDSTIVDNVNKFSIQYPQNWTRYEIVVYYVEIGTSSYPITGGFAVGPKYGNNPEFVTSIEFRSFEGINETSIITISHLLESDFQNFYNAFEVKEINEGKMKIGNKDAYYLEYLFNSNGVDAKEKQIVVQNGNKTYEIRYTSPQDTYDNSFKNFDSMISTLRFTS